MDNYKRIVGHPKYAISKSGEVLNLKTLKLLKPSVKKDKYVHIELNTEGKASYLLLHRAVYDAWIGIPKGLVIDHIDNNRENCNLENLQAITKKENINKKFKDYPCPKLINKDGTIVQIKRPISDFAKTINIGRSSINNLILGNCKSCKGWRVHELY